MGRVSFSAENRGKVTNFDFPKLKLEQNEKARIIIGLEDPVMEFVHTLRKPVIAEGRPVTEQVRNERTGVTTTEYKKDFVGNPICLGDASILASDGLDPKHCPACRLAKEHPDYTDPPKRRFAMHVVRYRTKAGTFNVATPFSVELLVWGFTDMVFNKILDAKEEHGDIRKKDFLLGPCTNKGFQKFDINVGAEAAWLKNDEWKQLVAQTFKENQIPDLSIACGRSVQPSWMQQDIDGVLEAWNIAKGAQDSEAGSTSSLGDDLNGLLGADGAQTKWAESSAPEADDDADDEDPLSGLQADAKANTDVTDGDDLFGDLLASSVGADESESEEAPVAEEEPKKTRAKAAPKEEAPAAEEPAAPKEDFDNFDDLLAGV